MRSVQQRRVDVFVGSLPNRRCPVTAVVAYMVTRGDCVGSFFITRSKSPLTKSKFVSEVCSALDVLGLDQTVFSGHSFEVVRRPLLLKLDCPIRPSRHLVDGTAQRLCPIFILLVMS